MKLSEISILSKVSVRYRMEGKKHTTAMNESMNGTTLPNVHSTHFLFRLAYKGVLAQPVQRLEPCTYGCWQLYVEILCGVIVPPRQSQSSVIGLHFSPWWQG